jgi:hypothetical protein
VVRHTKRERQRLVLTPPPSLLLPLPVSLLYTHSLTHSLPIRCSPPRASSSSGAPAPPRPRAAAGALSAGAGEGREPLYFQEIGDPSVGVPVARWAQGPLPPY